VRDCPLTVKEIFEVIDARIRKEINGCKRRMQLDEGMLQCRTRRT
jgi:hypothetical protein